jgi:pyruvate dehydrogenase E2 component (dihydrolipoamide acetyltransferase)
MGMSEAQIVRWYKRPGDSIEKGEPLLEVEAAKTVNDVPAPSSGVLSRIVAEVGDVVQVYALLAVIDAGGDSADPPAEAMSGDAPGTSRAGIGRATPADQIGAKTALPATGGVPATPRARRLAQEHGLDLSTVVGTGSEGRVTDEDVQRAVTERSGVASQANDAGGAAVPLTGMRGEIARRMHRSLQDSAQLTLMRTVDVTALGASRKLLSSRSKLSYNDLLVRATALALRRHPLLNATCDGRVIHSHSRVNIGFAVALEEGLVVPVLRDADRLSLRQLSAEMQRLTALARHRKLAPTDLDGGTFSVSNLGALDIDGFTPIVNPPQTAILGFGRIAEHYTRCDDRAEWRLGMVASLTIDHRAVDGAPGAQFLRTFAALCAAPDEWAVE